MKAALTRLMMSCLLGPLLLAWVGISRVPEVCAQERQDTQEAVSMPSSRNQGLPPDSVRPDFSAMPLQTELPQGFETVPFFELRGHYKNLAVISAGPDVELGADGNDSDNRLYSDLNRLRLSPEIKKSNHFVFHAEIDNEIIVSNFTDSRLFDLFWKPSSFNDLFDLSADTTITDDYYYRLKLHRFYIKHMADRWTVTAGRQLIRFGSGRLWNPLDILNPITPTFVEGAEDQKAGDALKIEYYPGAATEVTLVYGPRRVNNELDGEFFANRNTNVVCRMKTSIQQTDIALLGGQVAQRYLLGADIAAIVHDGMLRGSLLYADPEDFGSYFLGSAGYEYTFPGGIYFLLEYFYNQNGLNQNDELRKAYAEFLKDGMTEERYPLLANQFITFNRHYLGLALGYDITPLLRGDIFGIADFEGRGIFLSPTLRYNLFQNVDVTVAAFLGHVFEGANQLSDFSQFEESPTLTATFQWYF